MNRFRGSVPYLVAGLLIHAFFFAALGTDLLRPLFYDASHTRRGFDFGVFYLAGQALAEGRDIYSVSGAFGFRYLPAFALIANLFAHFQPLTAYLLHLCCTELFLATNLYLTWRWVEEPRRGLALFMWLAYLALFSRTLHGAGQLLGGLPALLAHRRPPQRPEMGGPASVGQVPSWSSPTP